MKLWHVGILSEDAEKTVDFLCAAPGADKSKWVFVEVEFPPSEMVVGDGGKLLAAIGRLGDIVYEILQPLDDKSYHAKVLKERGPGAHHYAYVCEENQEETVAALKSAGARVVWEAVHGNEHVYYLESPIDGTVLEIINCLPFMPEE